MTRLVLFLLVPVLISAAEDPFAQDRTAIYRSFLTTWSKGAKGTLMLKRKMLPIKLTDYDRKACLQDIDLVDAPLPDQSFDAKIIAGLPYAMDDRESVAGYAMGMSVSEIVFDKTHRFGVMRFQHVCGPLCGNGATVVFEKLDGEWTRTKRRCGSWIS